MKILLASQSPRRRQILEEMGHQVEAVHPTFDEQQVPFNAPPAYVETLAAGKGRSIKGEKDRLLVAADTIVCLDGVILGKPSDEKEAFEMLRSLSGRTHHVYTGVYLRYLGEEQIFTDCTAVHFRPLSQEEIRRYIATGSPLDKAGAYGIQDSDFAAFIEGSFTNVVGFPAERFEAYLQEIQERGKK